MARGMLRMMTMDARRSIPLLLIVLCFSVVSFLRAAVYESEVSLYADTSARSPNKARPHNNLGNALKEEKRIPEAIEHLQAALALLPDYPDALNNLGTIYCSIGRRQEGLAMLQRALALNPAHLQARFNVAMQYYENGMLPESEREYQTIIRLAPLSKEAAFAYKMMSMIDRDLRGR